jgi:hypothetical protein
MGQEYFINSQQLESQVRKLLPSQGGIGAGNNLRTWDSSCWLLIKYSCPIFYPPMKIPTI